MKKLLFSPILFVLFTIFPSITFGQILTIDENFTPQQLVQNILVNNPCAGTANISATGHAFQNGNSFAYFNAGNSNFPFAEGIVLSTGRAASVVGPNDRLLSEGPPTWAGDPDLEDALQIGQSSVNATIIEFDFMPLSSKFSFEYIFASEQYLVSASPNQCNYTDGFAFLLKEANTTNPYQNLAVLPGTSTPVRVNTVRGTGSSCPAANPQYFAGFNDTDHPINFNGQTVVMKAEAEVTPGVLYHIKLVVADQGNNLYDSAIFLGAGSFKIEKDLGEDRLIATENPVCLGENITLDATEIGNNSYQWFKDGNAINNATNPTFVVQSGENGTYSVEINYANAGCVAKSDIKIEYSSPIIANPATLIGCDISFPGQPTYNLNFAKAEIINGNNLLSINQFFSDAAGVNQIVNPASYTSNPRVVYALVENQFGCKILAPINLTLANNIDNSPSEFEICDNDENQDGITSINLDTEISLNIEQYFPQGLTFHYYESQQDADLEDNEITGNYLTASAFTDQIWLKIKDGENCYLAKPIDLIINTFSPIGFEDTIKVLCNESNGIQLLVIDAYTSYKWNDELQSTTNSIFVTTPGIYTVEVSNEKGCIATKTFNVTASSIAEITAIDVQEFGGGNNSITVNYSGEGDYVFSLDGTYYQSSNYFGNVRAGIYTVYVKDLNKCGISTKEVYVLDYPKYFTPNNDGYNDFWNIKYIKENHPNANITIFDRYGKFLFQFNGFSNGWDGTFNRKPVLADDYWFVIELEDHRIIKNHFSLKR